MHTSKSIEGILTEIAVQNFADRVLVLVTQLGKVGNLIQATLPATVPLLPAQGSNLPEPSPAIQLTPLLGSAPTDEVRTLHSLYAAQIATMVWTAESEQQQVVRRSVVVGVALKPTDGSGSTRSVFIGVMSMLQELLSQQQQSANTEE